MKQSISADDTVRQLQMDVEPANGTGQALIERQRSGGFEWAWLLWLKRRTLGRWLLCGIVLAIIIAFVIPKQYESTTRLMPADTKSAGGLGMAAFAADGDPSAAARELLSCPCVL